MVRFNKIEDYPNELKGRFNSFITTQFDDSMSVEMQLRSIIKWAIDNFKEMDQSYNDFTEYILNGNINPFIEMLNDFIEYMNEFTDTFDERYQETILNEMQKWYDDGTLETIISESLDTKYHEMDERLTTQLAETELYATRQFRDRGYNIKDFGALGDNVTDDTQAFQEAFSTIPDGRELIIPPGNYVITDALVLNKGLTIRGTSAGDEGYSVLRYKLDSKSGLIGAFHLTEKASNTKIHNLYIKDESVTKQRFNGFTTANNIGYTTYLTFDNVWVTEFYNGFHLPNVYLSRLRDCIASRNINGFFIPGFSTSIIFEGCYASSNLEHGYFFNDMVYSSLTTCAADNNKKGYYFNKTRGVKVSASGAELNTTTAFHFVDDNNGVHIDSCFGYDNGGNPNTSWYATFLQVEKNNENIIATGNVEHKIISEGNRGRSITYSAGASGSLTNNHMLLEVFGGPTTTFNGQYFDTKEPVVGKHHIGKVVWNKQPVSGRQVSWLCTVEGVATNNTWEPNTDYAVGQIVHKSVNVYECIQAGTSGATGPLTEAVEINDGTVKWTYLGKKANFIATSTIP